MQNLPNKEIVYVCIPTTRERRARLQTCIDHIRVNDFPHVIVLYENQDGGCVAAEHNMLQGIEGLVFLLNDDMEIAPDCIRRLYEAYRKNAEEMSNVDDFEKPLMLQPFEQIHKGRLAVSPFCHSSVLKKYVFKGYNHNFNDTELTEVVRAEGRYVFVPEATMVHRHGTEENGLMDETYRMTSATYRKDRALFHERKAAGFIPKNS
ncbi:MAG: hypothetical protein WC763_04670 [Candidatus Paceibacterota bacterium]|jgi:GT2 family glycosyltransferase